MTGSFAKAHKARVMAEKAASAGKAVVTAGRASGGIVATMVALLASYMAALKSVESHLTRAAKKQAYMPDFAPYIQGVLKADKGGDDPILPTIFVWAGDVADWSLFATLGDYMIRHGLAMPEGWTRTPASVLVETLADAYKASPGDDLAARLMDALIMTEAADMADAIRAKAYKSLADAATDPAERVRLYELAERYGASVKTALTTAKKAAEKAATEAATTDPADPAATDSPTEPAGE